MKFLKLYLTSFVLLAYIFNDNLQLFLSWLAKQFIIMNLIAR